MLYRAIQRIYRNAMVDHVRSQLTKEFGAVAIEKLREMFAKKDPEINRTYWDGIKHAAEERRSGGTGELSTIIQDEFELLGVEHLYNVFDAQFDVLCPAHAGKTKRDKAQAKAALLGWVKHIKNVRDPVSHPVGDDIGFEDATQVLYSARKALDFCLLPDASTQILRLQSTLLGGYSSDEAKTYSKFPPDDEVVLGFVGRHRELSVLNEWLTTEKSKRWALSGEGGRGKSAIAYIFGKSVARRMDHGLEAVFWMSAKRRRFVEGAAVLIDRPDFFDKASAIENILRFFDVDSKEIESPEKKVIDLLDEFPTLLIVDDIDTVQDAGEDAIQFLVMTIPELTRSRVLLTSRKAIFGLTNVTTQIEGISKADIEEFLKSKCDLMGVNTQAVIAAKDSIMQATDSSPLYIEDLLRLHQTGLSIEKSIGIWKEKRGTEARKYAIQREYDQLDEDSRQVLLALSLHGACTTDALCKGLDWSESRLIDALSQLRKMFLMARNRSDSSGLLALNRNIQILVLDVFQNSAAYNRVDRQMKATAGTLKTKRSEDEKVGAVLRKSGMLAKQFRLDEAEDTLVDAISKFPGRADVIATLAWVQKKKGDVASARNNFLRAHELGGKQYDAYWHWSEMEAASEEWKASEEAAKLGIERLGEDQALLFRQGYALHRQGRELILEGDQGTKQCEKGRELLRKAQAKVDVDQKNSSLRSQIYRAIVLNEEALNDGSHLNKWFDAWRIDCPNDEKISSEYERLRQKYPEFLRPTD